MSLLTVMEDVTEELPIDTPSTVIGNTDQQVKQLLAIANRQGKAIALLHEWNQLVVPWTFTTTADPHKETFPTDRSRGMLQGKVWRQDSLTPLEGPVVSSEWTFLLEHVASSFPGFWRIFDNALNIRGLGNSETILTEYVSNEFVVNAAGDQTFRRFQADDDTTRFDEHLLTLGIVWWWRYRKGLEYAEDLAEYERYKELAIGADRDAKPISMSRRLDEEQFSRSFQGRILVS